MHETLYEAERYFVHTFIRKERRDRLWFELSHPKKRYRGLSRFCHQSTVLLSRDKISLSGKDLIRQERFQEFVRKNTGPCRILSPDAALDGQVCSVSDAVALCVICPDASVIVGSHFAIVNSEPGQEGTERFLLVE